MGLDPLHKDQYPQVSGSDFSSRSSGERGLTPSSTKLHSLNSSPNTQESQPFFSHQVPPLKLSSSKTYMPFVRIFLNHQHNCLEFSTPLLQLSSTCSRFPLREQTRSKLNPN
uniref:Uncharacterized protein n=1 Tax=Opuntia streptacantha TaxID=393608 RepID=A0A7C9A0A9_OPUST